MASVDSPRRFTAEDVASGAGVHPVAHAFPLLRDLDAYQWLDFVESIRDGGQMQPIVLHDGLIIDGRNRLLACLELHVEPRFVEFEDVAQDGVSPADYAFVSNINRRHLTDEQRAFAAAEFERLWKLDARQQKVDAGRKGGQTAGKGRPKVDDRQRADSPGAYAEKPDHVAREKVAQRANVSTHKARQALNVAAHADDETKAAVRDGKLKLKDAQPPKIPDSQRPRKQRHPCEQINAEAEQLRAQFNSLVAEEVERRVGERSRLLAAAEDRVNARALAIVEVMDYADFRAIRSVLHPDRWPEAERARMGRLFDAFNRLEKKAERWLPLATLREHGWQHIKRGVRRDGRASVE